MRIDTIRDNLARVHVYMKSLNMQVIKDSAAYDSLALLGDVGGTVGLFIGLSVMSVVEIIELIVDLLVCLLNPFKKNEATKQMPRRVTNESEKTLEYKTTV